MALLRSFQGCFGFSGCCFLHNTRTPLPLAVVLVALAVALVGCEMPVEEEKRGTLRVDSNPQGARVFLDGSDTGRMTPVRFEVDAGSHTVRLTRAGMEDWGPRTVTVAAGRTRSIDATLTPLPEPPQEEFGLGLELLQADTYQSAHVIAAAPVALPRQVDLSQNFPPPGNQGQQGSCVGWAVAYALKSYHERDERTWSLADEEHLMSPAYVYNQIRQRGGGSYFVDAFDVLLNQGVASLKLMPYDQNDYSRQPSAAARAEAANYKIAAWGRVDAGTTRADFEQEMKRHLVAGSPLVIGIPVYPDFQSLSPSNPIYDDSSGVSRGGHAIVIVGYDDARSAFRIVNSWGNGWGVDGGYGWIDYGSIESLILVAYVVVDERAGSTAIRPSPVTQPLPGDGAVEVAQDATLTWTKGARTTSFDIYVGTDPQQLGAVDFQGSTADAEYQGAFAPDTVYYWRIDSRNAAGITRGPVWSFTTGGERSQPPQAATNPDPADGASGVAVDADLSWNSGGRTTTYDVYLGTDATPDSDEHQATVGTTLFDPGPLSSGTQYYWRVDANNAAGTTPGAVWSFTTAGAADTQPSFGTRTVANQSYPQNTAIAPLTLPPASGGNAPLTYRLTPAVPGLTFNPALRQLSGTPTASGDYYMAYTVTDVDGDSDALPFTITVDDHAGPALDDHGDSISDATDLPLGGSQAGRIEPATDLDYFRIETVSSALLVVYTEGSLDTHCTLYNASGDYLYEDADTDCRITFVVDPGTYYVSVGSVELIDDNSYIFPGDSTGDYIVYAHEEATVGDSALPGTWEWEQSYSVSNTPVVATATLVVEEDYAYTLTLLATAMDPSSGITQTGLDYVVSGTVHTTANYLRATVSEYEVNSITHFGHPSIGDNYSFTYEISGSSPQELTVSGDYISYFRNFIGLDGETDSITGQKTS